MWRRGRRQPVAEREGDLVVRGRVHARLLGVPLLDIDAHVVVTPARPPLGARRGGLLSPGRRPITTTATIVTDDGDDDGDEAGRPLRRRPVVGLARPVRLARADDLIAESASLLDEASRIR